LTKKGLKKKRGKEKKHLGNPAKVSRRRRMSLKRALAIIYSVRSLFPVIERKKNQEGFSRYTRGNKKGLKIIRKGRLKRMGSRAKTPRGSFRENNLKVLPGGTG